MMRRVRIESRALENQGSSIIFILGIESPLIRATMIYHRNGTKAGTRTREIIRNSLSSVPFDSSPFPPPPRRSFSLLSTILSLFHCWSAPMNNFRVGRVARPAHVRGYIDWKREEGSTTIHSRNHERVSQPYRVGRSWPVQRRSDSSLPLSSSPGAETELSLHLRRKLARCRYAAARIKQIILRPG